MHSALSPQPLETAIVFTILNRPDTTQRVWDKIKKVQPKRLYIISDGARPEKIGEYERVLAARNIVETVDWPCEVMRDYAETKQGDFQRIQAGFALAFKKESQIIWLEDDCLPGMSFFPFCEAMLKYYEHNEAVSYINGSNLNWGNPPIKTSYYFSRYSISWGFAVWKRSWELFQPNLNNWLDPVSRAQVLSNFPTAAEKAFWTRTFDGLYERYEKAGSTERKSCFHYYLKLAFWAHKKYVIMPSTNLITNIGFGSGATHTEAINKSHIVPIQDINVDNLLHPTSLSINEAADNWTFEVYCHYREARPWKRFLNNSRKAIGRWKNKALFILKLKSEK